MNEHDVHGVRRYGPLFGGMALCALVFAMVIPWLLTTDGLVGGTVSSSSSPIVAVVVILGALLVCAVIAGAAGRMVNPMVGLFVLGSGLTLLSWRTEAIEAYALAGSGRLGVAAAESAIWGIVVFGAVMLVYRITGPCPDIKPRDEYEPERDAGLFSPPSLLQAACGLAALPIIAIFAQSSMKGQAWASVVAGATVVGLVARLLAPHTQPRLVFLTPILFVAIAQAVGAMMVTGGVDAAFIENRLLAFNLVMPIDVASGALIGVSMGVGWGRAFLHEEPTPGGAVTSPETR